MSNLNTVDIKQTTPSKRELKRIEWNIVKRLVILIRYAGRIKKTKIAMNCNMAYDKCILYLDWMETLNLISREKDDSGFELISLSDRGAELCGKLNVDENSHSWFLGDRFFI